jgi:hypothetical protein
MFFFCFVSFVSFFFFFSYLSFFVLFLFFSFLSFFLFCFLFFYLIDGFSLIFREFLTVLSTLGFFIFWPIYADEMIPGFQFFHLALLLILPIGIVCLFVDKILVKFFFVNYFSLIGISYYPSSFQLKGT